MGSVGRSEPVARPGAWRARRGEIDGAKVEPAQPQRSPRGHLSNGVKVANNATTNASWKRRESQVVCWSSQRARRRGLSLQPAAALLLPLGRRMAASVFSSQLAYSSVVRACMSQSIRPTSGPQGSRRSARPGRWGRERPPFRGRRPWPYAGPRRRAAPAQALRRSRERRDGVTGGGQTPRGSAAVRACRECSARRRGETDVKRRSEETCLGAEGGVDGVGSDLGGLRNQADRGP